MCGIIGATGGSDTLDFLLEGLARLEYRGYDSAGVALVGGRDEPADRHLWRVRAAEGTSSMAQLRKLAEDAPPYAATGIGHTRWATHGRPSERNAHPHVDCTGRIAIVHNGIIENHLELSARLEGEGHEFTTDTDTEVLAHLIEAELAAHPDGGLAEAVRRVVPQLRGSFAVAACSVDEPDVVVAARRVSPLVIGQVGEAAFLASDIPALLAVTREFLVMEDDEVAVLRPGSVELTGPDGGAVARAPFRVSWDLEAAQKGGFPDFMSKEIAEQPRAVADTLTDRVVPGHGIQLDEMRLSDDELRSVDKIFIVACGSSYHAGLAAKYAIEHWVRLPVEIDIASEFRYRDPVLDSNTLVIGVSQSGETVDTLQAMREAHHWGANVLVISNVVDSSMAREADAVLYTRAGPEIGVAATKTFVAQLTALNVLALYLAQVRGTVYPSEAMELLDAMGSLPEHVGTAIGRADAVARVADAVAAASAFIFLGRHVGYPIALEGALKLKEISYLRAEGFPAGELKHGPIALIEPGTLVIGVATRTRLWEKMMANVAEVRSRGATVLLVANDGDAETAAHADHVLYVPATHELFAPVVDVVPLQQLAYSLARIHGLDVDRPRNLAKVVTVE